MGKRDLSGMKKNPYAKKKKGDLPRYNSRIKYGFLQYVRIILRWATANYDLTRPEVEMLLYLYPVGLFTQKKFSDYQSTISIYHIKTLTKFLEDGWIKKYRDKTKDHNALFTLTDKAKKMCNRMHNFALGEEDIPVGRSNKLSDTKREDAKRIDSYYINIINKMNRGRE